MACITLTGKDSIERRRRETASPGPMASRRGPVRADELLRALAAGPRIDPVPLRADLDAFELRSPAAACRGFASRADGEDEGGVSR
jgi:hypothetical protein